MAKRKRNRVNRGNQDDYALIPRGSAYKPYISIQDVPSLGRSTRVRGIKTGRQHDFLSDLERNYFMILEFCNSVVDIREQFPLELRETILIAEEMGIKHPIHPVTKEHITMTSDFCITTNIKGSISDVIRTTKYKKDLNDRRVMEKLAIEEIYWERRLLDWAIVTELEVDKTYSLNIADVLDYYDLTDNEAFNEISINEMDDIIVAFIQRLIDPKRTIRQISSVFERDLHLQKGAGIALYKHLIAKKYISVDLYSPLQVEKITRIELMSKAPRIGEVI